MSNISKRVSVKTCMCVRVYIYKYNKNKNKVSETLTDIYRENYSTHIKFAVFILDAVHFWWNYVCWHIEPTRIGKLEIAIGKLHCVWVSGTVEYKQVVIVYTRAIIPWCQVDGAKQHRERAVGASAFMCVCVCACVYWVERIKAIASKSWRRL